MGKATNILSFIFISNQVWFETVHKNSFPADGKGPISEFIIIHGKTALDNLTTVNIYLQCMHYIQYNIFYCADILCLEYFCFVIFQRWCVMKIVQLFCLEINCLALHQNILILESLRKRSSKKPILVQEMKLTDEVFSFNPTHMTPILMS